MKMASTEVVSSSFLLAVSACADPGQAASDEGEEDPLGALDDKTDSLKVPTDMGEIGPDAPVAATLGDDARVHMWTFDTDGEDVCLTAHTWLTDADDAAELDTVLYLFRQRADGTWGRALERNDDGWLDVGGVGGDAVWESIAPWSAIERVVTPGRYALVVKGKRRTTFGDYTLALQLAQGVRCGQ